MFSTPAYSQGEAGRAFRQRRVSAFCIGAGAIGLLFLVFRLSTHEYDAHTLLEPTVVYHFAAAALQLVSGLALRWGKSPRWAIAFVEFGCFGGSLLFYELMGRYIPPLGRPELVVILAMSFGFMLYAAFVPSTPRRLVCLGVLVGIPLLLIVPEAYRSFPLEGLAEQIPEFREIGGIDTLILAIRGGAAAWWSCMVICAAMVSWVIYGLRRQVSETQRLGPYTLVERLGEGGMGVVYRAEHAMLRRPTAIKLIPAEKSSEQAVARFEREVRLTARLTHPNTVTIFDYGRSPDDVFYYAMELLEGGSLEELVELTGPMPAARVRHLLAQAAGALHEAHAAGLIHRDIKPANIMATRQGGMWDVTKVVDFGLVKDVSTDESPELTRANAVAGTPQYIAPEMVISADTVDGRADLYALGAVACYLLTAQPLFTGRTAMEICMKHARDIPQSVGERGVEVPPELVALIMRCVQKDPNDRPADGRALRAQLLALDLPPWTEADADAWWRAHGEAVRARHAASVSPTHFALQIDRDRRGTDTKSVTT